MDNRDILLDVRHLRHVFPLGRREFIRAVDEVSFQIRRDLLPGEQCLRPGGAACQPPHAADDAPDDLSGLRFEP